MNWMVKNSKGKPDAMLTFAVGAFLTVVAKVLVGGVSVVIGTHTLGLGTIDATTIAALLTPTLGAYVARRHTDAKHDKPSTEAPSA